jgi:hypothetical protein
VLTVSKDRPLLTTITGSLPRPHWFVENLKGRPFSLAMTEVGFREQYSDAIAAYFSDQTRAGLDLFSDGDARCDCDVGSRLRSRRSTAWSVSTTRRLPAIFWSTPSTTRCGACARRAKCGATPAGAIPRPSARKPGGAFTRTLCPYFDRLNVDVITFEAADNGRDELESFAKGIGPGKKIAIGVISHRTLQVERPEAVANLIRRALKVIPPERLIVSTDCGFGHQGMSRLYAFYRMVAYAGHEHRAPRARAGRGREPGRRSQRLVADLSGCGCPVWHSKARE